MHTGVWWQSVQKRNDLEGTGLSRIILKQTCNDVGWIDLAQDRKERRAVVNAVTNICSQKMRAIGRLGEESQASQEGLCSKGLMTTVQSYSFDI